MSLAYPKEVFEEINDGLSGYWVESLELRIQPTQHLNTLTELRSRLLDFVLKLSDELDDVKESDVKKVGKSIDAGSMFSSAVFGDNPVD